MGASLAQNAHFVLAYFGCQYRFREPTSLED